MAKRQERAIVFQFIQAGVIVENSGGLAATNKKVSHWSIFV